MLNVKILNLIYYFSTKVIVGYHATRRLVLANSAELEKHAAEMVGKIKVQKENVIMLRLHAMDITVAHRLVSFFCIEVK